jgi:RHS repeat-associated protein
VAYVGGDALGQLARGTAGSVTSAPSEWLVPRAGHLGTTLAAVDASGNVVETAEGNAFGELVDNQPRLRHQFAGEYWDAEAGLTYLRQRWYSPASGRLLSLDRAQGQQNSPRTLHRYNYAGGDPVNRRDPSGKFEMAMGMGITLNINANLAAAAVGLTIGGLIYPYVDSAVRSSIWDVMVLMKVTNVVPDEATEKMAAAKEKADKKDHKGPEEHHTVPKYLCGVEDQVKALVTYSEHQQIHAGLSAVQLSIEAAGTAAADTLNIPLGRRRSSTVMTLGKTQVGRAAISSAIGAFYTLTGAGSFGGGSIATVFASEGPLFVGGKTWCMP